MAQRKVYSGNEESFQVFLFISVILMVSVLMRWLVRRFNVFPQGVLTILLGIAMGLLYMVGGDQLEISSRNMMGKIATKYVIDGYVPIFIVSTMYRINKP